MDENQAAHAVRNAVLVIESGLVLLREVQQVSWSVEEKYEGSRLLDLGANQVELGLLALEEDLRGRGVILPEKPEHIRAREQRNKR